MAEVSPLSASELRVLASLVRHRVRFMVVGLSAAALQGAPVVTEDVDLWFENLADPNLRIALKEAGATYIPALGLNPPMLGGEAGEVFDIVLAMSGLGRFTDEMANTVDVTVGDVRLKVLSLERILTSKAAANRPKDRLAIPVLENVLRTIRAKRTKKERTRPKR